MLHLSPAPAPARTRQTRRVAPELTARGVSLADLLVDGDMLIAPALATRMITEGYYSGQGNRHLTPSAVIHSLKYVAMMDTGVFRGAANAIYVCILNGKAYLVDGYHRMRSIVMYGAPVIVRVVILNARSETELAEIYAIYNRGARDRSEGQVRASFAQLPEGSKITAGLHKAMNNAMPLILTGFAESGKRALPPEMQIDSFYLAQGVDWFDACELYQEALSKRSYKAVNSVFYNASVVGVGLITFRYSPEKAAEFWSGFFNNGGLADDDPRRSLLHALTESRMKARQSILGRARVVESAWRKFCLGKTIRTFRIDDSDADFTVYGTPYRKAIP